MAKSRFARSTPEQTPVEEVPPAVPGQRDENMQSLEAILFLAHEPLNARKLSQYAGLADGTAALTLIRRLNGFYEAEGRAFRVEQVSGGYQLMTHPALADWLRRLAIAPAEVRLSTPAMETLAVVAYRQPVQRADIEAIRGVACGEMLRQLMERELVRIEGRSEELGRPFLYGTTNRFLHVFGLGSIDDLPRAESLRLALPVDEAAEVGEQGPLADADAASTTLVMKESKVTATIDEVTELDPTVVGLPGEYDDEPSVAVADLDDEDDDWDDDDDDIDDDDEDDFDDDFDDEFEDDDDWDDDDLDEDDDDLDDDEDDDEWEEVEDDDDEDDDEDEDWEEDDED